MKASRIIFHFALGTICLSFSALAAAAVDNAGTHGSGAAELRAKASPKKADASCDAPDATKAPLPSQQKPGSCLVSLSALGKLRASPEFTLVDVRAPKEFDRYHIADSINIPLHLVKTKAFLKKQSVVLVNEGRSTIALEKTCADLKQSGFEQVAVLEGGLFGWQASKRALQGDPVAQSALNRMTAAELFEMYEGHAMSDWSVIDVSTPGKYKDMRAWLPATVTAVSLKAKGDPFAKISSDILKQRKKNPHLKVLMIADDNEAYERIDARLKKSGMAPGVLRLDAGYKGYREHVKKQVALWKEQQKPRRYAVCKG